MESSTQLSSDVVVVGAGPTGMTVAGLLAARGLKVAVLERRLSTSDEPKAISLDDESLRVYQQSGIVDDVLRIIVPGTGTRYYDAESVPLFQAKAPIPYRLGYPFKNPFAQPDLERVLAERLRADDNVSMNFGAEVVSVHQDENGVLVDAIGSNGPLRVSGQYILGADGGRSTVREILGIGMTGRSYQDVWLVVDTLDDWHSERFGMHHGDPRRPHVIVPGLNGRCRYEFRLFEGEGEAGQAVEFDLIQRLLAPYRTIEPEQVERVVNYKFNALNADTWRLGRAFLLGDAAHMMPPFAGQGLNSGIRDAGNIAWKLGEVVHGRANEDILDSYQSERKPHAQATIELSVRLGSVAMTTSRRVAEHRDLVTRSALSTAEGSAFFEEMRYRPLAKYTEGLVVRHQGRDDDHELLGTALGQPLVFDASSKRTARLDDILGQGWSIIGVETKRADWDQVAELAELLNADLYDVPLSDSLPAASPGAHVLIDLDDALYREFSAFRERFVLLRPDRFIAAVWEPQDTPEISSFVEAWRAAPAVVDLVPAAH